MGVSSLFQNLIAGLIVGSVYGLIALGYLAIYRSSGVVNFAQGAFAMLGALITLYLLNDRHMNYLLAAAIAIGGTTILGVLVYLLVIARLRSDFVITQIMATLGVGMLFEGFVLVVRGGYPQSLPAFSSDKPFRIGSVSIPPQGVWVVLMAAGVLIGLYFLNNRTLFGKKMTATATDPMAASLVGISRNLMIGWSFAISAAIGASAGIFLAAMIPMNYASGSGLGLKGFIAAILGGWGKSSGAVVGGLALGVVETFGASVLPAGYKDAISFFLLIVILYFRPKGIMGSSLVEGD